MYLGGLKKDIKRALKSGDAAALASALKREQAKLDKSPNSKKAAKRADYVAQLQAKLASAPLSPASPIAVAPSVAVAANTPDIPASFAPSGGGGSSGGIPMPQPDASGDAPQSAATETDYTPWLLGAAAILGGILYFKRKRG